MKSRWLDARETTRLGVAAVAMVIAGIVHLVIAPTHFSHSAAHGLFFGLLGVPQILWAVALLAMVVVMAKSDDQPSKWMTGFHYSGLMLSGGAVVLWLLTQWVQTPFATSPEPIDTPTVVSKLAELIAAIALLVPHFRQSRRFATGIVTTCVMGVVMWSGGLAAESRFPVLMPDPGHDHGEHDHSAETDEEPLSFLDYTRAATRLVFALAERSEYDWQLPPGFPAPRVPENNPMTAAKVELGRHLFYDQRLSGSGGQSCASCHRQDLAFSDGVALAQGSTGEIHPRNSMALVNIAYNATLTWAHPELEVLEDQVPIPMFGLHPIELGITGNEEVVLDRFRTAEIYQPLFREAFPAAADPVTWDNIVKALSSFTRALISGNSAYDRFVYQGETDAMSASAQRGMELFLSEDFECHHCHGGFNFSVASVHQATVFEEKVFHNTGLYDLGNGAYPHGNEGAYEVTHLEGDRGKFRPPTLRNIAVTAPYMHDGSIATLEDVIDTYAAGGRNIDTGPYAGDGRANPNKSGFVPGFPMTEQEKADLIAFLHALTDESFLTDARFADPFATSEVASVD
ncbi:MAG: MbnH family di-heme enzyme [Acidobacteriota bacterium]